MILAWLRKATFFRWVLLLAAYQPAVVVASVGFGIGLWGGDDEDSSGQAWAYTLLISAAGLMFIWAGLSQRAQAPL